MEQKKIRIELLSDLCVSSGDVYNSLIDIDVCSDSYGIPYIPAKRIKGCLREAALELQDWGEDIAPEELFGGEHLTGQAVMQDAYPVNGRSQTRLNKTGQVTMGNAYPENYESYIREISEAGQTLLVHPQIVKEQFCYLRTQTSIHYDTGVADDNSLRTIRVIKRGNVFEAEVNVQKNAVEKLENCCAALHYMGMGRTRGLGHVKVTLVPGHDGDKPDAQDKVSQKQVEADSNKTLALNLSKGRYRLDYTIRLKAPLICKSVTNDQEASEDYISGSKILGMIAGFVNRDQDQDTSFDNFFSQGDKPACKQEELICSNAYLSMENHRFVPVAASVYTVKNHDTEGRDKMLVRGKEKLEAGIQLNQARGFFVDVNTGKQRRKAKVQKEQRYHHSRPIDKSIGHVVTDQEEKRNGSQFYQIESISPGQSFSGYIVGSNTQIEKIYGYFQQNKKMRMGYNRSAEYGEVEIIAEKPKEIKAMPKNTVKRFALKFEAPVIEYNENGMYSTEARIIQEEVAQILDSSINNLKIEKRFLSYTVLGGYNTTWHERKPTISAIDKGSVLVFSVEGSEGVDISALQGAFLGERVAEGYGEISVIPDTEAEAEVYEIQIEKAESPREQVAECEITTNLLEQIGESQFKKYIDYYAREAAREDYDSLTETYYYHPRDIRPTVGSMILMCGECLCLDKFEKNVEERFSKKSGNKETKLEIAKKLIKSYKKRTGIHEGAVKLQDDFCEKYHWNKNITLENIFLLYMKAYLEEMKYGCRESKSKDTGIQGREE